MRNHISDGRCGLRGIGRAIVFLGLAGGLTVLAPAVLADPEITIGTPPHGNGLTENTVVVRGSVTGLEPDHLYLVEVQGLLAPLTLDASSFIFSLTRARASDTAASTRSWSISISCGSTVSGAILTPVTII